MEGPTPVSALIHAATMVTAGVFLICRTFYLFEYSPNIGILITILGSLTAFIAGTIGLVQNDLKRVIAYSTCSQLGYMVFACGVSHYDIAFYHLTNHAFFKAALFMSKRARLAPASRNDWLSDFPNIPAAPVKIIFLFFKENFLYI